MKSLHLKGIILIGACLALLVSILFVSSVHQAPVNWGKYWMVRPLIVLPIAGAAGGFLFYYISRLKNGRFLILLTLLGALIYLVSLWLGTVLGFAGTLWN